MANVIGKYAAKKLLRKQMEKYKSKDVDGDRDPYFAKVKDPRTDKMKKVKKQVPDYIPEHDAKILARVRSRAYKLDMCLFNFLGIRFGWSSVVGLIPGAGDLIDGLLAFLLYSECRKVACGLDPWVKFQMIVNIALDFAIGVVPVIGDLGDAAFKANTRNLRLLEKTLDSAYKPKAQQEAESRLPLDQQPQPATVYEDFSDEEYDRRGTPPAYEEQAVVRAPAPARVPTETRGGVPADTRGKGWRSSGSRRERQPDIEMGIPRNGKSQPPGRSNTKGSARR
ncbi:hypothetical protein AOQ84DRAFT_386540 [Glonium stellatum]|uniref:Ph domain-containing protein n=1 Tax=Glonium stellatum TaxID=574774 RepID=A0A8E2F770_9PEZI|nr:hypothetical protein AOQ84DRAFT_386540 [Glonium stellatum]